MFGFGQKQTRAARFAGVRPKQTAWLSFKGAIRDRYVLVRLGLCAGALLLLLVALESWKSPFPFRLGTAYPHGLAAKADFEIVDEESTNRARDRAEAAAPRIFRHNASLLTAMPERLQAALAEVAQSPDLESLSLPTREALA